MKPFVKKAAVIHLIPDGSWNWLSWDGHLTIHGVDNTLLFSENNSLLGTHVPGFSVDYQPQQYTAKGFSDVPGIIGTVNFMVDEPTLSKVVIVDGSPAMLSTTTGSFIAQVATPSEKLTGFGTVPDPQLIKNGTWSVVNTNQQVFREEKHTETKHHKNPDKKASASLANYNDLTHHHDVDGNKKIELSNGQTVTMKEARVRAFLRMIRVGEGTTGQSGYEKLFGGKSFIKDFDKDFSTHPDIKLTYGEYTSTAAGAYQINKPTFDDPSLQFAKYGLTDFSPTSQDKMAVLILKQQRALTAIENGDFEDAVQKASPRWASLPVNGAGQPKVSWTEATDNYNNYLDQELQGDSDLHVTNDFLDKF